MQRPVHPLFGGVKPVVDVQEYGWTGKQIFKDKKVFQNHRYCQ